jgi:hypothetical protein
MEDRLVSRFLQRGGGMQVRTLSKERIWPCISLQASTRLRSAPPDGKASAKNPPSKCEGGRRSRGGGAKGAPPSPWRRRALRRVCFACDPAVLATAVLVLAFATPVSLLVKLPRSANGLPGLRRGGPDRRTCTLVRQASLDSLSGTVRGRTVSSVAERRSVMRHFGHETGESKSSDKS